MHVVPRPMHSKPYTADVASHLVLCSSICPYHGERVRIIREGSEVLDASLLPQSERDPLRSVTTRALKTQEHAARVSLSAVPRGSTGYCQTQRSSFDLLYNFTLSISHTDSSRLENIISADFKRRGRLAPTVYGFSFSFTARIALTVPEPSTVPSSTTAGSAWVGRYTPRCTQGSRVGPHGTRV